jgi:hypothetical protein
MAYILLVGEILEDEEALSLSGELLQWIQLDITEEDFRAFRLKENFTAGRKSIGAVIRQLAIDVLLYMAGFDFCGSRYLLS